MAAKREPTDGPRTIEQIEQRAAEIHRAECDALRSIAAFLREQAVNLPVESRLPLDFAEAANTLDTFSRSPDPAGWGGVALHNRVPKWKPGDGS